MKLEPSFVEYRPSVYTSEQNTSSPYVSIIVAVGVGCAFLVLFVGIVVILLQRRKNSGERQTTLLVKRTPEKPLTLKKPTAVRSPGQVVGAGVILKKTPSPTGGKTPPGGQAGTSFDARRKSNCSTNSDHSHQSSIVSPDTNPTTDVESGKEYPSEKTIEAAPTQEAIIVKETACGTGVEARDDCDTTQTTDSNSLGKMYFRLKYNYETKALTVTIEKCMDLVGRDSSHCDPYVKLHLMPEKQHKVKTRVLMRTRNPVYDEEFTFFGVEASQLQQVSLNFVVLSFDRFSRDKIIGEVNVELAHMEFDTLEKQISFVRDICPKDHKIKKEGRGELLISLCYQPAANRLTVVVLKARNLPKMDFAGLCDPYVKIYLISNGQRIAKKKTHIKKRTLNPVFNESFVFDVPYQEGLENLSLEFLMLDYERVTKNEVIGKLVLDMKAGGEAQKHWEEVANKPRRQIAEWHKLQQQTRKGTTNRSRLDFTVNNIQPRE